MYEAIHSVVFISFSLIITGIEHLFLWFLAICILQRNIYVGLLPIFSLGSLFLLLNYMSCLHVLEIRPLLVTSFTNIFSQSISCLFVLFIVSFAVQKLTNLIMSHLFTFCLIFIAFRIWPKKTSVLSPLKRCFGGSENWISLIADSGSFQRPKSYSKENA